MPILYRFPEIMPTGITVLRYGRLLHIRMERVWIPALRRFMAAKDWSQQKLAEESGVRPNTISDALKGSDPRIDTFEALAKALGVPLWALFCEEREYALFTEQIKREDAAAMDKARQDDMRAVVQAELAPLVDSIVAKLTGQSAAEPANPLPSGPKLAPPVKPHHKKKQTA